MFLVVFRSFAKKKEMVRGEKKSRTTNLDFPSVLLNQGLTEANNNLKGRKLPLPFFTNKEEKRGKRREEKRGNRQLTLLRARHDAVCLLVNTFRHKTTKARTRITQQEKQREYIKTRSQTTRSSPHRKRTNTDLSLNEQRKERRRKSISKSREKEVLRARAIWIWTFQ